MTGIKDYSTTPSNNTAYFPEGMAPSNVNDYLRQVQADMREWYESAEWINLGHTPTRTGNTTFTIGANVTTTYTTGRRIKCTDSSTLYGTIVSSSFSSPNTTVTVHLDSGNLSASLTAVAIAAAAPTNISSHPNSGRKGSDIASASTTDLSGATGDFIDVTGTTTITALGTLASGVERVVRFTGALTLTHNASSLILPGATNITTAANDVAVFRSLGSGNWVCVSYSRADGTAVSVVGGTFYGTSGANIASSSTTDLSAATGSYVLITGTTTINSLGTVTAGRVMTLRFNGALTLTHNGSSLILPSAANITTAANDVGTFISLGSGNWVCVSYLKADGTAVASSGTIPSAASQSDQETSTSTNTYVSPGLQHYHPSAAKVWCEATCVSSTSILASYNMTSVTDNGTGDTTFTIATDFSSSNWACVFGQQLSSGVVHSMSISAQAAGSVRIFTFSAASSTSCLTSAKDIVLSFAGFGDHS